MIAKVGGYVAPSLGALVVVFILLECYMGHNQEWFCGGKCLPCLLLLGAVICQGLTFVLFQSELFCAKSETIDKCVMDEAAYRSLQATICYFVCFILYLCGRTPNSRPLAVLGLQKRGGGGNTTTTTTTTNDKNSAGKKTGDFTKQDYEKRRKEKKIKGRGVSGRSKQQIYHDIGSGDGNDKKPASSSRKKKQSRNNNNKGESGRSNSMSRSRSRDRSSEERKLNDDYVDTEPDGMDWPSAHDPKERDEYYDKKRSKKQEDDRDREYYDEEDEACKSSSCDL